MCVSYIFAMLSFQALNITTHILEEGGTFVSKVFLISTYRIHIHFHVDLPSEAYQPCSYTNADVLQRSVLCKAKK